MNSGASEGGKSLVLLRFLDPPKTQHNASLGMYHSTPPPPHLMTRENRVRNESPQPSIVSYVGKATVTKPGLIRPPTFSPPGLHPHHITSHRTAPHQERFRTMLTADGVSLPIECDDGSCEKKSASTTPHRQGEGLAHPPPTAVGRGGAGLGTTASRVGPRPPALGFPSTCPSIFPPFPLPRLPRFTHILVVLDSLAHGAQAGGPLGPRALEPPARTFEAAAPREQD